MRVISVLVLKNRILIRLKSCNFNRFLIRFFAKTFYMGSQCSTIGNWIRCIARYVTTPVPFVADISSGIRCVSLPLTF